MRRIKFWTAATVFELSLIGSAFGQMANDPVRQRPEVSPATISQMEDSKIARYYLRKGYRFFKEDRTSTSIATPLIPFELDETDGEWCRARRFWIKRSDLVPIDEAVKYYSNLLLNGEDRRFALDLRADAWQVTGEHTQALIDYTTLIGLEEDDTEFRAGRAQSYYKLKDTANAIADLQAGLRNGSKGWLHGYAPLYLAWLLAATPDAKFRDPHKAIEITKGSSLKDETIKLTILAVAYADLQDFDEAVKCEEQVLADWRGLQSAELEKTRPSPSLRRRHVKQIEKHEVRLQLFRQRQPYRDEERSSIFDL